MIWSHNKDVSSWQRDKDVQRLSNFFDDVIYVTYQSQAAALVEGRSMDSSAILPYGTIVTLRLLQALFAGIHPEYRCVSITKLNVAVDSSSCRNGRHSHALGRQ